MKRAIIRVPEGVRYESLTPTQQEAIDSVFAQFVLPVPGTQAADGFELVDGLARDNFDPSVMPGLGMDWPIIALCDWQVGQEPAMVIPLDGAIYLSHLEPTVVRDEDGNIIETIPPTLREVHRWAGWPALIPDS